MKKRIVGLVVLILVVTGIFFCINKNRSNDKELTLYGNIEIRQVDLSFQVGGKIKQMLKDEGDYVTKGELLAVLDDRDYYSDLEKSVAETSRALALRKNAASKYKRNLPLCSKNIMSKQDCETLFNTKKETEAAFKSALAMQKIAKNKYGYTKLYAPEDGIITVRIAETGATVNITQPIYTMAKIKPVWIRAYVSEKDLGNIKYGMNADVLTDSKNPKTGENRKYKGYVGYISPVAEFTPKTVQTTDLRTTLVYRIRVYVDDIDDYLRQGMPVTIKINTNSQDGDSSSKKLSGKGEE